MNIQSLLTKERSIHNDGTVHYPLKQLTDDELSNPRRPHTTRTMRDSQRSGSSLRATRVQARGSAVVLRPPSITVVPIQGE